MLVTGTLLYQWMEIATSVLSRSYAPYILRVLVGFTLLINVRSFPLLWHVRVFLPLAIVRCKYHFSFYKHILSFKPAAARHHAAVNQLESLCPVGANPFTFTVHYKSWASPDDCDFLGHLSNSSYAKARDVLISQFSIKACPTFVGVGGCVILGASHYQFLREIPLFARYEIKLSIGAWDQKWMYLVCRFTSHSKNKRKMKTKQNKPPVLPIGSSASSVIRISTPITPSDSESSDPPSDRITQALASSLLAEGPDGPTVHCFSISRVCFKIGRITVPPPVLLGCEGFSKPPSSGSYSHDAPPPHWIHPHTLRLSSGSLDDYHGFLTKSWRDVAKEDRWWVEPLNGPVEEQRLANLAKLDAIQSVVNVCMDVGPYA
ncbi:hypothetical protein BDN67DRAFT_534502 [Paxillus ammoniavirescens]|nr:hypothetical protein BDN67DRAFT_534502 [Paxillus ammoniavirescens]